MEKTIFALRGVASVGKSQTLLEVYNLIITKFPKAKCEFLKLGKDVRVIIIIGTIKIGIESQGDPNSRSFKSIPLFIKNGCSIIICASRTRGGTVKLIKNQSPPFKINWYEKLKIKDDSLHNNSINKIANNIFSDVLKQIYV